MIHIQPAQARVLVVDADLLQRRILAEQLGELGFDCEMAATPEKALEILQEQDFDVVLLGVGATAVAAGVKMLSSVQAIDDAPEIVILALDSSPEPALAAIRAGAYDYLSKPVAPSLLEVTIKKAAEKRRLVRQNSSLRGFIENGRRIAGVSSAAAGPESLEPVSESPDMNEIIAQAQIIARLASTVLITGESGTGKDVLARYIHERSARAGFPLVTVNCGAIPENLFESEFFGYEKGAFSGATQVKRGLIEVADGSTLFLDEIAELPSVMQVKILRFLESGEFRRVGGTRNLYSNARLIAATNQDLLTAMQENRFRSDLFYRLNVIELFIPPLRERRPDLPALIEYYLDYYRRSFEKPRLELSSAARRCLETYDYPGNVRELKNIIERAAALTGGDIIEAAALKFPKSFGASQNAPPENGVLPGLSPVFEISSADSIIKLEELERRYILSVLEFTDGNRDRAAALLGISRRTLFRRLKEYEKLPDVYIPAEVGGL